MEDVDGIAFSQVIDLWCGKDEVREDIELDRMMLLASLAERFEIQDVVDALEDDVIELLDIDNCAELLRRSREMGLIRIEGAARKLALDCFESLADTEGFMGLDECTLSTLLQDDSLCAKEEVIFERLVGWMKHGNEDLRGRDLLRHVRFGLMNHDYKFKIFRNGIFPTTHADWIDDMLAEEKGRQQPEAAVAPDDPLRSKAFEPRVGTGVVWDDVDARTLPCDSWDIRALVECGGRVCSGGGDGVIRVWNTASLEQEVTMELNGADDGVNCLATWEGRLISGHNDGRIRVWDVATGACERELEGHSHRLFGLCGSVYALATAGARLLSGALDRKVKVWRMAAEAEEWPLELTLLHSDCVRAVAAWGGKAICGTDGGEVRVWDLATGACDAAVAGHPGGVCALLVHGRRLLSAGRDGAVQARAAGTWRLLDEVGPSGREYPRCLAVCGPRLVSGWGELDGDGEPCEGEGTLDVWDLARLDQEHALPLEGEVKCLLALAGGREVWAGVGRDVVVWGRP